MSQPLTGTPIEEAGTIAASEAIFLTELAAGKYDKQWAAVKRGLLLLAPIFPAIRIIVMAFEILIRVNKITAPDVPLVADRRGGAVPISNSRYDPKTGRFLDGPFSKGLFHD